MLKNEKLKIRLLKIQQFPITLNEDNLMIIIVLDGDLSITHGIHSYQLEQHCIAFINKHESYCFEALDDNDSQIIAAEFNIQYLSRHVPLIEGMIFANRGLDVVDVKIASVNEAFYREIIYYTIEMYLHQSDDDRLDLLLNRFAYVLYSQWSLVTYQQACRNQSVNSLDTSNACNQIDRFMRINKQIDAQYLGAISLEKIAGKEDISKVYLTQLWKQCCNLPFFEFVSYRRAIHAANQLIFSTDNIIQISFQSGFSDTKYLYKAFQRWFHCTPTQWRKKWARPEHHRSHYYEENADQTRAVLQAYSARHLEYEKRETHFIAQFKALDEFSRNSHHPKAVNVVNIDILDSKNINLCQLPRNDQLVQIPVWNSLGALLEKTRQLNCKVRIRIKQSQLNSSSAEVIRFFISNNILMHGLRRVQQWEFELLYNDNTDIHQLDPIYKLISDLLKHTNTKFISS